MRKSPRVLRYSIDNGDPMNKQKSPPATSSIIADAMPSTPPLLHTDASSGPLLTRAVHVLSTAATSLSHATILYQTSPDARNSLIRAVDTLKRVNLDRGKLLVCGVGKSGLVGRKLVATMKSLGLGAAWLDAVEALHGDLGDVRDVCAFVPCAAGWKRVTNAT